MPHSVLICSSVPESPCNRRIFHTCHCLYHIPFIPRCRWRISTSRCRVFHYRILTFPHIPPPHLVLTRVSPQPSLHSCHSHCLFATIPAFSPLGCNNFFSCRRIGVFIRAKTLYMYETLLRKLPDFSERSSGSTLAYAGADSESGASSALDSVSGRFWPYSSWSGMNGKSPSSN